MAKSRKKKKAKKKSKLHKLNPGLRRHIAKQRKAKRARLKSERSRKGKHPKKARKHSGHSRKARGGHHTPKHKTKGHRKPKHAPRRRKHSPSKKLQRIMKHGGNLQDLGRVLVEQARRRAAASHAPSQKPKGPPPRTSYLAEKRRQLEAMRAGRSSSSSMPLP